MQRKNLVLFFCLCVISLQMTAQTPVKTIKRPKLVVGIMIDQMRWDFLYRYADRYSADGFKRILREGFNCENTMIPYTPTVTAAGHTCVYTGSVPAIHGIAGNGWYDKRLKRSMYCSDDLNDTVTSVGGDAKNGKMSPVNMLTTTITDELRLATNFKSRVVGVCIKDRGAIFPAGHTANAAFWYDNKTGNWITSTYYMKTLPNWLQQLNNRKLPDEYYAKDWNTLYPIATYAENSTSDEKTYEGKLKDAKNTSFPHNLSMYQKKDYETISATPFGMSMTLDVAKAAMEGYGLGKQDVTDFLAVSLSSPDYVGHRFGPNSIEIEDTYLRLDNDLALFMKYLDKNIGKENYTLFLTADHGVAHIPGFMQENRLPAGNWDNDQLRKELNATLKKTFRTANETDSFILAESNYQVYLNDEVINQQKLDRHAIEDSVINFCMRIKGVANAFRLAGLKQEVLPEKVMQMLANGYHKKRSGDIQVILEPGWIDGGKTGTTHGLWNPYDAHIPLLWMGWGIKPGKSNRTVYMTDIAATLAALLHIQMPSGCIGEVITETLK
jgi:predicted AlkP superfamily pyrophosphatase or phosphodiesterase